MQTPPEIEFQEMAGSAQIEDVIEKHIAELEQRWGRITACSIVLKGPGPCDGKDGVPEVHIRLALPDGREVNVERTPPADERHADPDFALNNALEHHRRQLQDKLRRTQGQAKRRERAPAATVARLDPSGEFRFVRDPTMDKNSTSTATACSTTRFSTWRLARA